MPSSFPTPPIPAQKSLALPNEGKKRLRTIYGTVADVVQETSDTWTLHIEVDNSDRDYLAGQFISIDPHQFEELSEIITYLEAQKGRRELVRAYSMASAPHEPYISITVKPERYIAEETRYPPLLSPFLASASLKCRPLHFLGYTGAYVLPKNHHELTQEVVHLVAGSGIVPNFALLKDELINGKNLRVAHTLICVNKTVEDIIYKEQLQQLQAQFPDRLRLVYLLTRHENPATLGSHFYAGRPTTAFVSRFIQNPSSALLYACGPGITKWQRKLAQKQGIQPPARFLETASQIAHELGIDKKRFKKELYG